MKQKVLLVDVGSTFTKALVIDGQTGELIGRGESPTTIEDDVSRGLDNALEALPDGARGPFKWCAASSSAAGGLRIVSVGLTAALSGKAGTLAALGAGGKVVLEVAGLITGSDISRVHDARPHLIVLTGGTDGGNASSLLHNASALTAVQEVPAVIVAGNGAAAGYAARLLESEVRDIRVVGNVFPKPGALEIGPTREMVRELFLRHITRAKGLDVLMEQLGAECEPTPLAVSRGLQVTATLHSPVVLVDLGGATTDVHSVGGRHYEKSGAELPLPDVMRTVEGDMGMRAGAIGIAESMGSRRRNDEGAVLNRDLLVEAERRAYNPEFIPAVPEDEAVDRALAKNAVRISLERHVGRLVVRDNPWGRRYRVQGKDLRLARLIIGTGGVFRHLGDPESIIRDALVEADDGLLPDSPVVSLDPNYAMYAVGLVSRRDPDLALKVCSQLFSLPLAELSRTCASSEQDVQKEVDDR